VGSAAAKRFRGEGTFTFALGNRESSAGFEIENWINLQAIQLLVHHASSVVAAIVIFALVARLAIWLLPHGVVRKIVVVIDDVVLIGLLLYFGYEMFVYLWNRKPPLERGTAAAFGHAAARAGLLPSRTRWLERVARLLARLSGAGAQ
jgi:hypothetical protein